MSADTNNEKAMTMDEAMAYLQISSRTSFYKILPHLDYVNLNSGGDYEIRRFPKSALDAYLRGERKGGVTSQK